MKNLRAKKALLALISASMVALASAGLVYAWSAAQGKVQGIGVSVGSSGLLINGVKDWTANVSFDNILPGWSSGPIAMNVQNISQGVDLDLQARVLFEGENFAPLVNTMEMAIQPSGSTLAPDYRSLSWWSTNPTILAGGSLAQGMFRDYELLFRLPSNAGDEVQGLAIGLSVLLTGVQAP